LPSKIRKYKLAKNEFLERKCTKIEIEFQKGRVKLECKKIKNKFGKT